MSYRLIDANSLALKYPDVNDMPCIYADLPNGLDDGFYCVIPVDVKTIIDNSRDMSRWLNERSEE